MKWKGRENNVWNVVALASDNINRLTELIKKIYDYEFQQDLYNYNHWIARDSHRDPEKIVLLEIDYSRDFPTVTYVKEGMNLKYSGWCELENIRENYFPDRHHDDNEKPKIVLPRWDE
jgi:hypothetical protein